ncbi:acyl-CoA dehydrogenase family protein, partial [Klebsiella pneumoniae]|uniref:acyl-CoA dehydrogenase family protein n=1 Tax=Klebsiella pneumoniae TaxID=573 RepID=UPI0021090B91
ATKTFGTEFEVRVADFCARVLGPHATLADEGLRRRVARNICYAPGYVIMGGTVEILRNILGERVLGLPKEPQVDRDVPFRDVVSAAGRQRPPDPDA